MANPTKPKEAKPRLEGEEIEEGKKVSSAATTAKQPNPLINAIIIAVVVAVGVSAANYLMMTSMVANLSATIASSAPVADEEDAEGEEDTANERGVILDLGDFILNLADTNSKRFLKLNVAIELSKKESELEPQVAKEEKSEGHGGGHGEEAEASGDAQSMAALEQEMNQFKPAIRDAVISILSGKTSDELSTTPGKELAKEQIKESVNSVFNGEREVLRVSFGSFFIQ